MVVGAGVFGLSAAVELAARGLRVALVDPGPIPHPLAESTDISKAVRADYGDDVLYTELGERAIEAFRRDARDTGATLFHETGAAFLSREAMAPGGFEHESFALLSSRGHALVRLDEPALRARFPAFRGFVDGYFNPFAGFVESGAWVARLARLATDRGVVFVRGDAARLLGPDARVTGVGLADGSELSADLVVVAAGSRVPLLCPWTSGLLEARGQPVFHLAPPSGLALPVWGGDIARTGYYGFPVHEGVAKIANHGPGRAVDPRAPGDPTPEEEARLRAFVDEHLPPLRDARIVRTRVCVYSDTRDQHFLVAPDPAREGLVYACGGSGHAFKFAPLLGGLVADAVDGRVVPRFAYREGRPGRGEEQARAPA